MGMFKLFDTPTDYGKLYAEKIRRQKKATGSGMRKLAIIQSLILVGLAVYGLTQSRSDTTEITLCLLIIASQVFNMAVIVINPNPGQKGWLGLYIERKTLEEKKKIENLNKKS